VNDCIFCKIVGNQIPAKKIHEDEYTVAFNDLNPQAPVHILVIPKEHYSGIHEIPADKTDIVKRLFDAVTTVVKKNSLDVKGYRLIVNFGEKAGQSVPHIHVHILSGREMKWPPG
jgi:histidine triad (HIT) family protein